MIYVFTIYGLRNSSPTPSANEQGLENPEHGQHRHDNHDDDTMMKLSNLEQHQKNPDKSTFPCTNKILRK